MDRKIVCIYLILFLYKKFESIFFFLLTLFFKRSDFFDKTKIKLLIETIFQVKVITVNTYVASCKSRRLGKFIGRKNFYKRVFVKLVCL